MPKARRMKRMKMRVLKTIKYKCGRIEHRRGKVIEVIAERPYVKRWLKEGKIEACIQ